MNKAEYDAYLRGSVWRAKRAAALEAALNACQLCNRTKNLHVHHRTYERVGGDELLTDLTVLCADCHEHFHGIGGGPKRTVAPKKKQKKQTKAQKKKAKKSKGQRTKEKRHTERAECVYQVAEFFLDSPPGSYTAQDVMDGTGLSVAYVNAAIGSMKQRREIFRVGKRAWRTTSRIHWLAAELNKGLPEHVESA